MAPENSIRRRNPRLSKRIERRLWHASISASPNRLPQAHRPKATCPCRRSSTGHDGARSDPGLAPHRARRSVPIGAIASLLSASIVRSAEADRRAAYSQSLTLNLTLAFPTEVEHWPLTTPWEKLVKIGAKVVSHGKYTTVQLADVAVARKLFREIPCRIDELRPRPAPV